MNSLLVHEDHSLLNVGILGSGVMGKQIALFLALHGFRIIVWTHRENEALGRELDKGVAIEVRRAGLPRDKAEEFRANIVITSDLTALASCHLVMEAVSEEMSVKKEVLSKIDKLLSTSSILATNTSTLSITELSSGLHSPDRFAGIHFFNPPASMELVEVVVTDKTSNETIENILSFLQKVGKFSVVLADSPGFIVNRILFPMINEAISVLEEGICDAAKIDKCMKLGAHHPLGPLELADLIGLDVCLNILKTLFNVTGNPKYQPAQLLIKFVDEGNLGKKSGSGFYKYRAK